MRRKASPVLTAALSAAAFGFLVGIFFPVAIMPKLQCGGIIPWTTSGAPETSFIRAPLWASSGNSTSNITLSRSVKVAAAKPEGAERRLPPGIVVSESDLHLRRLWGSPRQDSATRKYLLALAVGYAQKANVNATFQKFLDNFDIVLFHYDDHTTEWDEFEWSRQVVHVSARKQTKWWFDKRFLHPSIMAVLGYYLLLYLRSSRR